MKSPRSTKLSTALLAALALTFIGGCTPPDELIKKMLGGHLEKCKSAEGDFAEIKLFDGNTEKILKSTCEEPVTELVIEDKIKASAKIGPYKWLIGQNPDSGVWVVSGIEWREMTDAQRILSEDDPDANTLEAGAKHFEDVEKALPNSPWVKLSRLELLLQLRKKTRNKKDQKEESDITGLGERAQTQYNAIQEWAKANSNADLATKSRVMIIDYYRNYNNFIDNALETQGSGDEHLQNAIKMAEKEKNEADAEKYRKELERVTAERVVETERLTKRQKALKKAMCEEIAMLSADGIKDDALKSSAIAAKESGKTLCAAEEAKQPE
ncbi:MAG: hypothetical protein VYE40_13315 [Myxococcota bacterium]|nr:hypothetical protein [Myxococcota bacterium]